MDVGRASFGLPVTGPPVLLRFVVHGSFAAKLRVVTPYGPVDVDVATNGRLRPSRRAVAPVGPLYVAVALAPVKASATSPGRLTTLSPLRRTVPMDAKVRLFAAVMAGLSVDGLKCSGRPASDRASVTLVTGLWVVLLSEPPC